MQAAMLAEMKKEVTKAKKMDIISPEHAQNAEEAIKFYSEQVKTLPFQSHPAQVLSEMSAIDYSQEVTIMRVKPRRVMTQMQRPNAVDAAPGSFYADGALPSDFEQQASDSGIGAKASDTDDKSLMNDKSVYQSQTSETSVFLRSTASPATDTWSAQVTQESKGGGTQYGTVAG